MIDAPDTLKADVAKKEVSLVWNNKNVSRADDRIDSSNWKHFSSK